MTGGYPDSKGFFFFTLFNMKDPAFLFYPGDASDDTQFLNRLERGCYFDILKAQKRFSRFSFDQIKKVLGNDFEQCWPSIQNVLTVDENELYYIEWVNDSIEKRKAFSESRRSNRSRANNSELFIYLMKDFTTGNYKIGSSVNPERRLIELQAKNPQIKLIYSFGKTAQTTEAELHKMFNSKQISNEFYELCNEDVKHIINHMTNHMKLHMTNHMENENENEIINHKEDELLESINIKEGKNEISLPDSKAKEAVRLYYQRNYVLITEGDVQRMFDAFKIQRVGSKKNFYQDESDVLDHFFNWLPSQKFELQNGIAPVKKMVL